MIWERAVEQVTARNGTRKYVTPDGNEYPSVTTVLGATADKSGLERWRQDMGEAVADYISDEAKRIGTAAHRGIERRLLGLPRQKMPLLAWAHLQMMEPLLARVGKVQATEEGIYSDSLGLAGTVDCVAEYNGLPCVIDFKTGASNKKKEWIADYFLQVTAYCIMWNERHPDAEALRYGVVMISSAAQDTPAAAYVECAGNHLDDLKKRLEMYRAL